MRVQPDLEFKSAFMATEPSARFRPNWNVGKLKGGARARFFRAVYFPFLASSRYISPCALPQKLYFTAIVATQEQLTKAAPQDNYRRPHSS